MESPFNAVSNLSRTVANSVSTIQSKKEFIIKQSINAILLFVILLVFGCLDFATLTVHLEYLLDAGYWAATFSKTVAGVCAYNIGINLMWDTEIKKDIDLALNIDKYNKLIQYKQNDFEYFVVHIFNPKEKKKAYISQINRRIYWLNRFSKDRDQLLYSSEIPQDAENRDELVKELELKKSKNKYCIRRQELEELKKPDFIEKNLDSLKVRYYEVNPASFELEIDGSTTISGVKTVGNVGLGKAKASAQVVLGMLGFSMFITAIGLELNSQEFVDNMAAFWHYALKCATDVGIIAWQTFRGMLYSRKLVSQELTKPYAGRNTVLTEYLEWRLSTNQPNSLSYIELHKNDNVEEIELTEEQLKELTKKEVK